VLSAATRFEHRGTLLRPAWALGDASQSGFSMAPVRGSGLVAALGAWAASS
jgi:hypothetical protein